MVGGEIFGSPITMILLTFHVNGSPPDNSLCG